MTRFIQDLLRKHNKSPDEAGCSLFLKVGGVFFICLMLFFVVVLFLVKYFTILNCSFLFQSSQEPYSCVVLSFAVVGVCVFIGSRITLTVMQQLSGPLLKPPAALNRILY